MAKIIYSTYHPSALINKYIVILFTAIIGGMALLIGIVGFIANFQTDRNNISNALENAFSGTLLIGAGLFLLFLFFSFPVLLFSLHLILTDKILYLYSPLNPFIVKKLDLINIDFIRIKTSIIDVKTKETHFIIHFKDTEQLPLSMPWVDNQILKEKLESLGITTVIYDFPAKAST